MWSAATPGLRFHLVETSLYERPAGAMDCGVLNLGLLVVGAQKIEAEVERLRTSLRGLTGQTRAKAEPKLRESLTEARRLIEGKGNGSSQVMKKVEDVRNHVGRKAAATLNEAEAQSRIALRRVIERAIDELEKAKRRLDRNTERMWHAS